MVLKHHPDVQVATSKDAEPDAEKFREITEAYNVLSVPESRASFDILRAKYRMYAQPKSQHQ
jgi:DnaJ-class molecular chaperone